MTPEKILEIAYGHGMIAGPGMNPPSEGDAIEFAENIIAQARAEMRAEQWIAVEKGEPHGAGQYVIRINNHGHIRLGQRVLNSDTLRHQWQIDGEVCTTVTHYHPIPPLTLRKRNEQDQ